MNVVQLWQLIYQPLVACQPASVAGANSMAQELHTVINSMYTCEEQTVR